MSSLKKYKNENTRANKFVVGKFLDYKMVDSKTVARQVEELQMLLHEMAAENVTLCETFQVAALIDKLPPGWEDFKNCQIGRAHV